VNLFTVAAGVFAAKVSASKVEWSARLGNDTRPIVNAQEATGIRELTAQEIDHVTGGVVTSSSEPWAVMTFVGVVGGLVGTALGALIDWIFD
jgi:hypothetical protein